VSVEPCCIAEDTPRARWTRVNSYALRTRV